jgi:hypothetical protein
MVSENKFLLYFVTLMFGIKLTGGKHLHDCTLSLRSEVWAHKTNLTLPLCVEVPVPSQ